MKNKAKETNAIQTLQEIDQINADINKKSTINPAYKELELAEQKTLQIIDEKQQKIKKINDQIQNNYNEFLKSLEKNALQLVEEESFSTTISSPLFTTNTETKTRISKQENPNQTYINLNK
ncbi:hypothetical protein KKG31_07795 [Patescibacteria group bacterium]|nr:hypothetical protein [Patescibacteria group bacterium]MBU1758968.1 hypothetical protein [Patescibacteria group bacterium]